MPSELMKNLMEQAHESRLVLPDFQRDFVWKPQDVIKLLASLLNGLPNRRPFIHGKSGNYRLELTDGKRLTYHGPREAANA